MVIKKDRLGRYVPEVHTDWVKCHMMMEHTSEMFVCSMHRLGTEKENYNQSSNPRSVEK